MSCHKNRRFLPFPVPLFLRALLIFIFLPAVFLGNPIDAQEKFIPAPARLITSFPFTMFTGGVMLIRARLGDFPDSLNFILDTGSGGISLDSNTCDQLKLVPTLSDKTILGIAGIRQVKFVYNQVLHIPGLDVDSLNFHVNDYDILSSVYGEKIDGIIGYSFLSRYIVRIDYDSLKVYIYTHGTLKYPRGGTLLKPVIVSLPVQKAEVKDAEDVNARFYFDTGAGLCLLLSTDFANDSNLLKHNRPIYKTQAQGLGGKANMRITVIKELKVGPYRFRNIPTYLFDDDYNVTSYPNLGGLLGNDILRRFNVTLNYQQREIYLLPNSHYRDMFDYSYTGLSIYWVNGEVRVGDIMPGSPAEKSGLKEDDVVVSINNNLNSGIQVYKNILQGIGDKVKIIVRRNGELVQTTLRVRSIL